MPKLKFTVNIEIDDQPIANAPKPLELDFTTDALGQPITAEGITNFGLFAAEISSLYARAINEAVHHRGSFILPNVMQTLYNELVSDDPPSPTYIAVRSRPGTRPAGEAGLILEHLLRSSRKFTTDLAGTQLGDWNDD